MQWVANTLPSIKMPDCAFQSSESIQLFKKGMRVDRTAKHGEAGGPPPAKPVHADYREKASRKIYGSGNHEGGLEVEIEV